MISRPMWNSYEKAAPEKLKYKKLKLILFFTDQISWQRDREKYKFVGIFQYTFFLLKQAMQSFKTTDYSIESMSIDVVKYILVLRVLF